MPVRRRVADECAQCGADVPTGAAFCASCGRRFGDPIPTATIQPPIALQPARHRGFRRWWPVWLVAAVLFIAAINAGNKGGVAGVGQGSGVPQSAPAATGPSATRQWSNANDAFQLVNNQLIAAQSSGSPDAATFHAIDSQAQIVAAQYAALPSMPGVDDSISNQVRDATNYWAKGIHTIAQGVATRDVATINAGNADLLAAASQVIAADNRLKAALAAVR